MAAVDGASAAEPEGAVAATGVLRAAGAEPVETVPLAAAAAWSACIDCSIWTISSRWSVFRHASRLRSKRVACTSTSARGKPSRSTRGPEVPPMLLADSCSVNDSASASSASFLRRSAWSASIGGDDVRGAEGARGAEVNNHGTRPSVARLESK